MSDDSAPKIVNKTDESAADLLLSAVSQVGEACQIVLVMKNKEDKCFSILANCDPRDAYWWLSQARHFVIDSQASLKEGGDNAVDS